MILYAVFFHDASAFLLFGMLLISLISFWDDISSLPSRVRLLVHLLAVTALLYSVNAFQSLPIWLIPIVYILIIGIINAYNFMDGINGITGLYSLIILCSLLYVNERIVSFADSAFIICPIIASIVFLFFNFRKKAKCFAGDVGSVSIGFWILALLLMLILKTESLTYILFLAVYGVDTVLTIIHRLLLRQNIFEPHRLHFYQILANERKVPHLIVSALYALVQLLVNCLVLFSSLDFIYIFILVALPLIMIYVITKPILMPKRALS
ncbi:MraY family glycosyltransferase [Adhaeribacter pallidiroseus]|uniref:UDP-N-acetylglucosamine--undecaprenyl-phosphateN-acetylglucosaminephosphotransferase n=1 Tax=Adhaeribacter pallidiroseus TaxID=2072847 RepID=A0A369QV19_9BACT|nr:UDP-GlcNAc--UDP-phosphate GlcNAc-1-phosphate transferase [Adhaeribacter pallidiroseus]RDC66028.1 UDP-N-acetylglucosamine--undecaprenyl-phosphateN-acetylglucosaminephosphotransferase [Adhaeribacter pallidiroseus]